MTRSRRSASKRAAVQAEKLNITGGQFNQVHGNSTTNIDNSTVNVVTANGGGFVRLQEAVATAAFHNSAQRVDPPKCHPNTREAVMENIMKWIMARDNRDAWIMWLHGAAGAGKSAIAQSIAEMCVKLGIPIASFFFFRTDPTRNNIHPLVATLAYQLARVMPASRDFIIQAIDQDPLVFKQSLEDQLESLILNPLRQIGRLSSSESGDPPFLILIDGLDECNEHNVQTSLIRTLSDISANKDIAVTFLIASRPESHITMAFNARKCTKILTRLALDNTYLPDKDIRLFLTDKFGEIRDTHPLGHLLNLAWPPPSNIDEIVEKSSGQFIYAAVVMNYVSSARGDPERRLEVCRGIRPARTDTPFAQLDALYQHIFSQVQDLDDTMPILAMHLWGGTVYTKIGDSGSMGRPPVGNFLLEYGARTNFASRLSDLASVVHCSGRTVKFLHASLPDFLCDPERSVQYYMDPGVWCARLALLPFRDRVYRKYLAHMVAADLLPRANPTPELQSELLKFVPAKHLEHDYTEGFAILGILSGAKTINFNDGDETYRRLFSKLAPYVKARLPDLNRDLNQLAPASSLIHSKFKHIFARKERSGSGADSKILERKDGSWGIVEHNNYMRSRFPFSPSYYRQC